VLDVHVCPHPLRKPIHSTQTNSGLYTLMTPLMTPLQLHKGVLVYLNAPSSLMMMKHAMLSLPAAGTWRV
jgi:hypothetical protein